MELQDIKISRDDGSASSQAADRVDGMATRTGASEREALLSGQNNGGNGEMLVSPAAAASRTLEKGDTIETSFSGRVQREMSEVACFGVRRWMVVLGLIIIFIIAVIIISVIVCSVLREDEDEKFDPSLFTVPQLFRGSFKLPNLDFSHLVLSNTTKQLVEHLEGKLKSLFGSSPALGRYFSQARISSLGNGSLVVDYQLGFVMPEDEQQHQLTEFTLSRDTVYNVFRQFLYDQESQSEPLYIDPASLSMS